MSDPKAVLDLGDGRTFTPVVHNGAIVGFDELHPSTVNQYGKCAGFVALDTPEAAAVLTKAAPKWQVISWDPLTLSPSILCRACGNHGWVRDGKWVNA